ncbi:hypothetical protein LCGC14_1286460 [marine sediment metagenome]|uniref:Uncharacterized protein n=1 Tax=marine sediment metagenome TaxID=412755 RepID=A0A0F9KTR6_9ZZZZ
MKTYYLVCTIGFAYVLPAETLVKIEAHKKYLRKKGYKKFLVYQRVCWA